MENTDTSVIGENGEAMSAMMTDPNQFEFYAADHLPSAKFWGFNVAALGAEGCVVKLPYSKNATNPFGSLYFAAMAGAGELSTGALCLICTADRGSWSTLVVDFRAEYYKKVSTIASFECNQTDELIATLDEVERSGEPKTLEMISIGYNEDRDIIAKIFVTWSFKKR